MKYIKLIIAVLVTGIAIYVYSGFFGNPIEYLKVKHAFEDYIDKNYDGKLEIEAIKFNFKTGGFYAQVKDDNYKTNSYLDYYYDGSIGDGYYQDTITNMQDEINNYISYNIEKETDIKRIINSMINSTIRPWRKKYKYWIMCDIALILLNEDLINNIAIEMKTYMSHRQQKQFEVLLKAFKDDNEDITSIIFAKELISQYRRNRIFAMSDMRRFIVTANMSAGKSTLINALIGKSLVKTSQEVCTGNICYIYNKPYEDNRVYLENGAFSNNASQRELKNISWDVQTSIASYFRSINDIKNRICVIDTPGVNSSINKEHRRISQDALKNEQYEKVIYIINANKLGSDEEIKQLKWFSDNIPNDKVIFIVNKLDDFNASDDNISASIEGIKKDLVSLGFEEPVICPISAYFSLLIKMKANGDIMTDDEIDEYSFYVKKFKRPVYDLSKYYKDVYEQTGDNEMIEMSKKCGLYGLEKILYGGTI